MTSVGRLVGSRAIYGVLGAGALTGLALAMVFGVKVFNFSPAVSGSTTHDSVPTLAAGSQAKFQYLSAQTTNSCGLQASTVKTYSATTRIQGACCNPMDMATYGAQVQGLSGYSAVADIPSDPYDVPASLAQRLLAYNDHIKLTAEEQKGFDQAMTFTPDKAPCCCKCWRWYAHSGLAKHLIHDLRWDAPTVGKVVSLVNGCGGPREQASRGSPSAA